MPDIPPSAAIWIAVIAMTGAGLVLADRYCLQERIASGGMGEVWRAADQGLQRQVAVKLLQPAFAGEPEARARFRAEARNASRLCHPAVARVYDFGEDASLDVPFLVMELVDGPSLADVLAVGRLDATRTVELIGQVAAGLQAAHSAGVVHRDVKPGNLVIGRDGQVKITDFGIASVAWSEPITRSGTLVGTPAYLAPERLTGGSATAESDLYSLGIVAYECLAGVRPFRGSAVDVAEAQLRRALPPLPPDVPADVAGLVAWLTAKNPESRPRSAREVSERAARINGSATGGTGSSEANWSGLSPAWGIAADSVTLTDLTASASLPAGMSMAEDQPLAGSRRPRRMRRPLAAGLVVAAALAAFGLGGWQLGASNAVRPPSGARLNPPPPSGVVVNSQDLVGQPVGVVLADLRRLGLRPRLVEVTSQARPPGIVLSVQPDGRVPVGRVVVVIAVAQPAHQAQPVQQDGRNGRGGGDNGGDGGGGNGSNGGDGGGGSGH